MNPYTFSFIATNGITPAQKEAGLTAAMQAYNASLPPTISAPDPDSEAGAYHDVPNPALVANEAAYVAFVMNSAGESYARQYPVV
jgi:hypothetical protein